MTQSHTHPITETNTNHRTHPSRPRLGLALSGGGLRGLAHLGVLQVIEEEHIPVDIITGTSMGGLVAGVYGAGIPLERLISFATKVRILDLASPDRSWHGLFDHRKLAALLADLLGSEDVTFEDLKIPVAVVAADLETGKPIILNHGPLIPALMATAAVPLLFKPVHHQGHWLVDGGVVNNLPFDVARQLGADKVLAVSVPPSVKLDLEQHTPSKQPHNLSLRALRRLNNHTRDWRLPFLIAEASIGTSHQLINRTRMDLCPPDILIQVDLPNIGLLTNTDNAATIKAGYDAAHQRRTELRTLTSPLPPRWQRRGRAFLRRLRLAWRILQGPDYRLYPEAELSTQEPQ